LLGEPIPILSSGPRPVIALVATALAGTFIVYLDFMRDRVAQEAAARAEAQRLAVESQLRLLRAQLEPHMLFNTLANLRSLVDVDPRMAQTMIDQLIVYLRSALTASREESTTLRAEFAQLRAYLEIMALRMGPRLAFRFELPDELQFAAIPPMLLQPLVENAIRHGIEPQIGNGSIEVVARRNEGAIEISVTDSGLGFVPDEESPRAGTGYGLVHVRERLKAFYGARASLTLTPNAPHGARALVRIPQ
jgi:LytS/YehU family sensor histidine kinase